MARPRVPSSPGGTSRPAPEPCSTSGIPPTAVATTGSPWAIASRSERGRPSWALERTKKSAAFSQSVTSSWSPANVVLSRGPGQRPAHADRSPGFPRRPAPGGAAGSPRRSRRRLAGGGRGPLPARDGPRSSPGPGPAGVRGSVAASRDLGDPRWAPPPRSRSPGVRRAGRGSGAARRPARSKLRLRGRCAGSTIARSRSATSARGDPGRARYRRGAAFAAERRRRRRAARLHGAHAPRRARTARGERSAGRAGRAGARSGRGRAIPGCQPSESPRHARQAWWCRRRRARTRARGGRARGPERPAPALPNRGRTAPAPLEPARSSRASRPPGERSIAVIRRRLASAIDSGPGFALADAPHRLRRAAGFLAFGDVREADHADQEALAIDAHHAGLVVARHQTLGLAQVVFRAARDHFAGHHLLDTGAGGLAVGEDADGQVSVGDRAQRLLRRIADGKEADVLVAHAPRGSLHRLLRRHAFHVLLHDLLAAHRTPLRWEGNPLVTLGPVDSGSQRPCGSSEHAGKGACKAPAPSRTGPAVAAPGR